MYMCSNSLLSVYDKIYKHIPELYFLELFSRVRIVLLGFQFYG